MIRAALKTIIPLGVLLAIFFGLPWLYSEPSPEIDRVLPYCQDEDYIPEYGACLWDSEINGNGLGKSFIAHSDGLIEYLDED